ncbi:hypothetical protein [Microbacterium sp. SLBN-146]|uniref:hypothetical protein n=1 Tax=Microbacterium sp. SLBN-146 TaxID=2768457 RepID=UPI0011502064|nr:hypothetical protein [Microbacterium sp. SLBN-146]
MIGADWIPHRRDDRELLGWIRPEGDDWVAVDLLGREASAPMDWLDAEEVLEAGGLAWLSDVWMLDRTDAAPLRVRIAEVIPPDGAETAGRIVVHTDDFGAIDVPVTRIHLPWPAPAALRPHR